MMNVVYIFRTPDFFAVTRKPIQHREDLHKTSANIFRPNFFTFSQLCTVNKMSEMLICLTFVRCTKNYHDFFWTVKHHLTYRSSWQLISTS